VLLSKSTIWPADPLALDVGATEVAETISKPPEALTCSLQMMQEAHCQHGWQFLLKAGRIHMSHSAHETGCLKEVEGRPATSGALPSNDMTMTMT